MAAEQQASNGGNPHVAIVTGPRRKSKPIGDAGSLGSGPLPFALIICGSLIYYNCVFRNLSLVTLVSDVFIVFLCSMAIVGLLFRQMNIAVPADPIKWQISQDTANALFACLANTIGAAESVLRVAATGHDKRFFLKVVASLYLLSAVGRLVSGATVAFSGLCLFCLYLITENSGLIISCFSRFSGKRESTN